MTQNVDSAHPQTPFEGQGVNMAITDAYVYATNIAVALQSKKTKSLKEANLIVCTWYIHVALLL